MPSNDIQPHTARPSVARYLILALAVLWCIYWFFHSRGYWEDDAYIHLEFARSLAAGHGFAFNGHVVDGDTAPLWVLLLAAVHAVIPSWMAAGKTLTVLGGIFGLAGIYAFARSLAARLGSAAAIFPAALLLLIVVNPYSCYWLFSGMEPLAAVGLACFAVLAATRNRPTTASFLTACLLAGLAPLLRPEMLFLTVLLIFPIVAQWLRLRARTASSQSTLFAIGLILAFAPLALWSLYSLHAFGHIMPNTNAAKRADPGQSVVKRLLSTYSAGLPLIVAGFVAGVCALIVRFAAVLRSLRNAVANAFDRPTQPLCASRVQLPLSGWIFILWPAINTAFYIANHTYVQTRYILVTAPTLTVVILFLILQLSPLAGRALYLAAFIAAVALSAITVRPFIANKALNCRVTDDFAVYIHNHIPPGAPVATYSIGQIAFVSQHPIIDTGGITRPGAIPFFNHPKALIQWAQSQGAQYWIASYSPQPGSIAVYTTDFPFVGWSFHPEVYKTYTPVSLWKLPPASPPNP